MKMIKRRFYFYMPKNFFKSLFYYFIIPVLVILIVLKYSPFISIILALAYLGYILYANRVFLYTVLGGLNYSKGNIDKSLDMFSRAYKTGKCKPRTIVSYAYLLLKSGNVQKSEELLNSLLDAKIPEDDRMLAKSNLSLALWKKGDLDGAVSMLEEVFANYKTTTVYGSLGCLLILKGDLEKALAFNMEAYDYNNSNGIILDNLGQTYYMRQEYDKAEEIYEKLMAKSPTFPEAYYNYGLVLLAKNRPVEALAMMKKALSFRFSFLSTVTREEVESKIAETENMSGQAK